MCSTFQKLTLSSTSHSFISSYPYQHMLSLFFYSPNNRYEVTYCLALIFTFPFIRNMRQFFICLLHIFMSSLEQHLFMYFSDCIIYILLLRCIDFFMYLRCKHYIRYIIYKHFPFFKLLL